MRLSYASFCTSLFCSSKWHSCTPDALFTAPITVQIAKDKVDLEKQLQDETARANAVFLWLDCDREGEAIAFEVIKVIQQIKPRIPIKRARFSAVNDREIFRALRNLAEPDKHQADAVLARQEIDLRIGAAFTRMQTTVLAKRFEQLMGKTISYGPCQFPTLGFVVDRYTAIEKFTKERFWSIHMSSNLDNGTNNSSRSGSSSNNSNTLEDDNASTGTEDNDWLDDEEAEGENDPRSTTNSRSNAARFVAHPSVRYSDAGRGTLRNRKNNLQGKPVLDWLWQRGRLFDHLSAFVLYEKVVEKTNAIVTHIRGTQETRKRPVPMNTITLQTNASRYLKIASDNTMKWAEELYIAGYISYPRTETEKFVEGTDLSLLLKNHLQHPVWGTYTRTLVNENGDRSPRFRWPTAGAKDDQAHPPIHPLKLATRNDFTTNPNLWRLYELVTRHFLACCSPDATGSRTTVTAEMGGEYFTTSGLIVTDRGWLDIYPWIKWGQGNGTLPPFQEGDTFIPSSVLLHEGSTEPPNLLSEAELLKAMDTEGIGTDATMAEHIAKIQSREYVQKDDHARFSPTTLGMALITAYNSLNIPLSKPWLRARMEAACTAIAEGRRNREDVVRECLNDIKPAYDTTVANIERLITAMNHHFQPIGTSMQTLTVQGTGIPPNTRTAVDTSFSRCGTCHNMMELRGALLNTEGSNRTSSTAVQFVIYCVTCQEGWPMPRDIKRVTPHEHTCPLCQYQVVRAIRQDRNSANERITEICPKCFTQPPPAYNTSASTDANYARILDMPCYKCSAPNCSLAKGLPSIGGNTNSSGTGESNDGTSVTVCGRQGTCRGMMKLKRTQAGKFFLSCDQYRSGGTTNGRAQVSVGGCDHAIWLPSLCTSVLVSDQFCSYCSSESTGLKVRLLYFAFPQNTSSLPHEMRQSLYTNNGVTYTYLGCVFCNESLEQFGMRHNPVVTRDQMKQVAIQIKQSNAGNIQRSSVVSGTNSLQSMDNRSHSNNTLTTARPVTVSTSNDIDVEELEAIFANDPTVFFTSNTSVNGSTNVPIHSQLTSSTTSIVSTTIGTTVASTTTVPSVNEGYTPLGFLAPLPSKKLQNKIISQTSKPTSHYTDNTIFVTPPSLSVTGTNTVNSTTNSSVTVTFTRDGVDYGNNGYPICPVHKEECVLRTANSANNSGRNFYICPRRPRKDQSTNSNIGSSSSSSGTEIDCNTFWWADQPIISKSSKPFNSGSTSSSSFSTTSTTTSLRPTTTGACFKCGSTEHWANNCPQTGNYPQRNPTILPTVVGNANPTGGTKRPGNHGDNDNYNETEDNKKRRKCGKCRQEGHTKKNCPFIA